MVRVFTQLKLSSLVLGVVLLLALTVRLWGIDARDIWYDEALTILQSEKNLSQINVDVPTPVHYFFVHFALLIGRSTLVLGLPSVILGLATIVLVYMVAKKLFGVRVGLVSAFLLAISPMHIEFSQQILFFSYFAFFSSLILYLVLDFASYLEAGTFKWNRLLLLVFVNWVNILTQMLALVLIPIQLLFLGYLFLKNPKVLLIFKKYLALIGVFIALLFLSLYFVGGGRYILFFDMLHIGFEKPITVGYSLSSQLGSTIITSPVRFLQATFSWFGVGGGIRFWVYISFFLLGMIILLWRKTFRSTALLFTLWLVVPFGVLFSVRMEHWFEEKYFIFMIPVYLIVIACGIVFLAEYLARLTKRWVGVLRVSVVTALLLVFICSGIAFLAIEPIKSRTTFGFPFEGYTHYSWRKVDDFLKKTMKEGDRVFVSRDNTMFLKYYFSLRDKKVELIEDTSLAALPSSKEYQRFTENSGTNYYVSIPDYQYLFLAGTTGFEKIKSVGNFGIYKVFFKKETPVRLLTGTDGSWMYYEDFRTARSLLEAAQWKNMATTYSGSKGMPKTEGYNELVPLLPEDAFIEYDFILPEGTKTFYINPQFSLDQGITFKILQKEGERNEFEVIYEKNPDNSLYLSPAIKVNASSSRVSLRFLFENKDGKTFTIGKVFLKSFFLYDRLPGGATISDYTVQRSDEKMFYNYDSQLEVIKSNKWIRHTVENTDWIQTMDGVLIRQYETQGTRPLVYKFQFGEAINTVDLHTKIFGHYTDPVEIYYSIDGKDWVFLKKVNDNVTKIYNFNLQKLASKTLFVRFNTEIPGPFSHVRGINFTASP